MSKIQKNIIASGLWLLAIFINSQFSFAQIPRLLIKFVETQNRVQSGYVVLQYSYITDKDTLNAPKQEAFFISTPKDLKYLSFHLSSLDSSFYSKTGNTQITFLTGKTSNNTIYYYDSLESAKNNINFLDFTYIAAYGLSLKNWEGCTFKRITPIINKNNIRYKIFFPDEDVYTNISVEWEFESKTYKWIQHKSFITAFGNESSIGTIDILENKLYNYIHPDILDTISFKYDELKSGFDKQTAMEQAIKDSLWNEHLYDSLALIFNKNAKLVDTIPNNKQEEISYFMPSWQFPLLSGDTLYSDSIQSRFLLLDMWYIACHPCRMAMRELAGFDTLFDESLLKMVSLNVADKDTAKMGVVVRNLNLKCDIPYTLDILKNPELSEKMGNCKGFPQIYLVDMKTKKVIWHSCGWYDGFTKDVEKIVREEAQKGNE